ncbi:MAG: hypothetical protein J6Z33_09915 [Lachnospiraceae bacterium]|nr:hypothetical protein [Lachnospiraceae bacterium]
MAEMVWYVCYGSNLLEERFLCYVRGGVIPGNTLSERGAKDTSLPVRSEKCTIDHELFFSTPSKKWFGSGVAYVNPKRIKQGRKGGASKLLTCGLTLGRRYLITLEQFLDVVRQENSLPADCDIPIDFTKLKSKGSQIVLPGTYYGRLLYLGDVDGYPSYSFTCIPDMSKMERAPLFGPYYDVIASGLKETFQLNDKEIAEYLERHQRPLA